MNDINLYVNLTQKKKQQRIEKANIKKGRNKTLTVAILSSWLALAVYSIYLYCRWVQ